jgi:uncharacterized protein YndB with AHSA1/START domain
MTIERIEHTSFVIERQLAASPRHAFRFFSEAELKARWNGCHPDWHVLEESFDFRVGGSEVRRWRTQEGKEQAFHAHYLDIMPAERIIYAYAMSFGGTRLSASLVTVTFEASLRQTRMTYTEQVAILAGGTGAADQRLRGTEDGLDRLAALIEHEGLVSH